MSPPRPSISPMSNAHGSSHPSPSFQRSNKTTNDSNEITRGRALSFNDDKSSSLSEMEDEEDEALEEDDDEEQDNIQRQLRDDDIDSEAETERIDQTPRKSREIADGVTGRTPSKLAKVEQADDDELSEPPSPLIHEAGAASSTSTAAGASKKRKHGDMLESPLTSEASDSGDYPHKRNGEVKEELSDGSKSREENGDVNGEITRGKAAKGRKSRRGQPSREATANEIEEEPVPEAEDGEPQQEEDPAQKTEAMDAFTELAKQFKAFRDALYSERIASIDAELALLEQPNSTHPEYLRMVASIDSRRVKQTKETKAYHNYRQIATRQKTLAERSQLHSQYFQTVREIREQALDTLGADWYSIQRERRQGVGNDEMEDMRWQYRYVDKRGDLLRQQAKYNREVSILSGMAKYVGFPAAPEITGVEGENLDNDMKAMKLYRHTNVHHAPSQHNTHRHTSHQNTYTPRPSAAALPANSERSAHDQYIEQHAWARAPQSANVGSVTTPNISHTPEWAEHSSGFRKAVFPSGRFSPATRNSSPFGTPRENLPRRDHDTHNDQITSHAPVQDADGPVVSKSSPLQVPKQRINGGGEIPGWRNISGTSTIDAPMDDANRPQDDAEDRAMDQEAGEDDRRREFDGSSSEQAQNQPGFAALNAAQDSIAGFRASNFRPLDSSQMSAASIAQPVNVNAQRNEQ